MLSYFLKLSPSQQGHVKTYLQNFLPPFQNQNNPRMYEAWRLQPIIQLQVKVVMTSLIKYNMQMVYSGINCSIKLVFMCIRIPILSVRIIPPHSCFRIQTTKYTQNHSWVRKQTLLINSIPHNSLLGKNITGKKYIVIDNFGLFGF